jgi:hypothetical protein
MRTVKPEIGAYDPVIETDRSHEGLLYYEEGIEKWVVLR